jgi:hypothetical protein
MPDAPGYFAYYGRQTYTALNAADHLQGYSASVLQCIHTLCRYCTLRDSDHTIKSVPTVAGAIYPHEPQRVLLEVTSLIA